MTATRIILRLGSLSSVAASCLWVAGGGGFCPAHHYDPVKCPVDAGVPARVDSGIIPDAGVVENNDAGEIELDAGFPEDAGEPPPVDAGFTYTPAGPWTARDYNRNKPLPVGADEYYRSFSLRQVCTRLTITNDTPNDVYWWEVNTPYLEGEPYAVYDARDPIWEHGRWSFQPETGGPNYHIPVNGSVQFAYCANW